MREGQPVALTPKVFDLLFFLVRNQGRTLTKDDLMREVWPGTFVEENNLSRNISMLRKVLGDGPHDPRFIKTIPKRGYRFEPQVHEFVEEDEETIVEKRTRYSIALGGGADPEPSVSAAPASAAMSVSLTRSAAAAAVVLSVVVAAVFISVRGWSSNSFLSAGAEPSRKPGTAEADELLRRGRELWRNRSAAGLHEATLLLEQAVEKDPNFAPAYAALADAYAFDVGNWKKTEAVANRAIALDPGMGEPYAAIGFVRLFWEWLPGEAESYFRKAVALSPDYATGHQWYAVHLAIDGQFNAALAEIDRSLELDPTSLAAAADRCQLLYFLQRYDEAESECRRVLEADANFFAAHANLYDIHTAKGEYELALEELFISEQLALNHSTRPEHLRPLRAAFEEGGIREFWRARIRTMETSDGKGGYTVARYYALLGETDKAIAALRYAYEARDFSFPYFLAEPAFLNCCIEDPRYRELRALWAKRKTQAANQ